jgi:dihydrofolate reductase
MKVSLVVAASDNHMIGKDNQLLWHLPKDMKFFKDTTWAMPVIMGRKTFESLGQRVLPGRLNIILTKQTGLSYANTEVVGSLTEAIQLAEHEQYAEVFVIGGGQIYQEAMSIADTIYMTRVHTQIEGDTLFPELDDKWILEYRYPNAADEKHAYAFDFECWKRK